MATPLSLTTPDSHCTQSSFFLQKKKQTEQNKTEHNRTGKKTQNKATTNHKKGNKQTNEKTKRGFEQQFSPATILASYREREREGWVFACYSCCGIGLFPNFVICLNQSQKTLIGK